MPNRYYYKLEHNVVPCDDVTEWAKGFETINRHVGDTIHRVRHFYHFHFWLWDFRFPGFEERVRVSTVFLGLDHSFCPGEPPILFETMVFGGKHDGDQERYSTWEEAEEGHRKMCEKVFGRKQCQNFISTKKIIPIP